MLDISVTKELSLIRWYLNWAADRGYHSNMVFKRYRAKLKDTKKPVIFLTKMKICESYLQGKEISIYLQREFPPRLYESMRTRAELLFYNTL